MSTIFNQLVKHRINEFNNCNPVGSGKHDVKPGQVIINELHPKPIGLTGETMFCNANWRPHSNTPFLQGLAFKMNTDVLYNSASRSRNKKTPVQEIAFKVVQVENPGVKHYIRKTGKPTSKYNVTWAVTDQNPEGEILTPKAAGLYLLLNTGRKPNFVGEAIENFYAQSEDSIRDIASLETEELFDIYDLDC